MSPLSPSPQSLEYPVPPATPGWWRTAPWQVLVLPLLIVALASAIRMVFFADLGRNTTYLTYYPAVVLAALFGGTRAGLLATGVSALLCFYWIQQGHMSRVESLAMGTFILSCSMISGVAEGMRRAQARAERERERAQAANQAKSVFLASMNHELRTPLNAILGFTEILQADPAVPPAQRATLGIIHRSGHHLLELINDVLDMAKIDAGRMGVQESAFDLHELVDDIVALMRARAEAKGLQLVLHHSTQGPRLVRTDQGKLRQILINLLGNAIKFTSEGGVALRLEMRPLAEQRWTLVLEVEDSGEGMAGDDLERIFQPFVRVGNPNLHKGTGLGLAITRNFVHLLGGQIEVKSQPGTGSTFKVELPVHAAQADEVPETEDARAVLGVVDGTPAYRILIVEDQEENTLLLQRLLAPLGFAVELARNGREGVEAFARWQPDLIWMDIRMPVLDGIGAAREIRQLPGGDRVRIVAVTASVFQSERERILAAGMDGLVRKPYRSAEIYASLSQHLGVQYRREATPPEAQAQNRALQKPAPGASVALDALPVALREALVAALLALDAAALAEHLRAVAALDASLGETLERQARQLDYSAMLKALRSSLDGPAQGNHNTEEDT